MQVLVPICCFCEKVRDDGGTEFGQGIWGQLETYRATHHLLTEEMWFSPTSCPDCTKFHWEFLTTNGRSDRSQLVP